MLNIADTLHRWCREARPFALATVVDVRGSAPLPVGTSVAVDEDGNAVGSIYGGCVEGAVHELCRQVLHDQGAPQRAWFGYSDDDAFAVGLTCGGELDVLVQRVDPATRPYLGAALADVVAGRPAALAQAVEGPEELPGGMLYVDAPGGIHHGTLTGAMRREVGAQARALLRAGRTARAAIGGDVDIRPERLSVLVHQERLSVLVHVHASRPPHADLRRRRLRRRPQPGRPLPRPPGHRVRRPPRLRHGGTLPARRRGRGRLAPPLPGTHRSGPPHRGDRPAGLRDRPGHRDPAGRSRPGHRRHLAPRPRRCTADGGRGPRNRTRAEIEQLDLTRPPQVADIVDRLAELLGRIDVLVINSGTGSTSGEYGNVTEIVTAIQQRHLGQFLRDTGGILSATGVKWPTGVRPSVRAWQVSVLGGEPVER